MTGLRMLEQLVANGDPGTILELGDRAGAERLAADLFRGDAALRTEFGTVAPLAAYLRSLAAGQVGDARRALEESGRARQLSALPTPAAALHALTTAAPRTATTTAAPAAAATTPSTPAPAPAALSAPPAPVPAAARRAAPPATTLEDAARLLRLGPIEDLPRTPRLRDALRLAGLLQDPDSPTDWRLDRGAVERLAADSDRCDALFLAVLRATPSACVVGATAVQLRP